jgi:hypothetical protein
MKYITTFFMLLSIISCCSKKNSACELNKSLVENYCPNDGICTLEIFNNKGLNIKNTNENKAVYEMIDNTDKKVILYKFSKNQEDAIFDGGYNESIIFEINSVNDNRTLINDELKSVKMFYTKQKNIRTNEISAVTKGTLILSVKSDIVAFNLDLPNSENNQIIKTIKVINGKL